LYITDKPADKLRMSLSPNFRSCQNLYDGQHKSCLPSNMIEDNAIAYLIEDVPYTDQAGNIQPFTVRARTILSLSIDGYLSTKNEYGFNVNWSGLLKPYLIGKKRGVDSDSHHFSDPRTKNLKYKPYNDGQIQSIILDDDFLYYATQGLTTLYGRIYMRGVKKKNNLFNIEYKLNSSKIDRKGKNNTWFDSDVNISVKKYIIVVDYAGRQKTYSYRDFSENTVFLDDLIEYMKIELDEF